MNRQVVVLVVVAMLLGCGSRYVLISPTLKDKRMSGPTQIAGVWLGRGDRGHWSEGSIDSMLSRAESQGLVSAWEDKGTYARATLTSGMFSEIEWRFVQGKPSHDDPSGGREMNLIVMKLRDRPEGATLAEQARSAGIKLDNFVGLLVRTDTPNAPGERLYGNPEWSVIADERGAMTHVVHMEIVEKVDADDFYAGREKPKHPHLLLQWHQADLLQKKSAIESLHAATKHGWTGVVPVTGERDPGTYLQGLPAAAEKEAQEHLAQLDSLTDPKRRDEWRNSSQRANARTQANALIGTLLLARLPEATLAKEKARHAAFVKRLDEVEKAEPARRRTAIQSLFAPTLPDGAVSPTQASAAFEARIEQARAANMTGTLAVLLGMRHRLGGGAVNAERPQSLPKDNTPLSEARLLALEAAAKVVPVMTVNAEQNASLLKGLGDGDVLDANTGLRDLLGVRMAGLDNFNAQLLARGAKAEPLVLSWKSDKMVEKRRTVRENTTVETVGLVENNALEQALASDPEYKAAEARADRVKLPDFRPDATAVDTNKGLDVIAHNIAARSYNDQVNELNDATVKMNERRAVLAQKFGGAQKMGFTGMKSMVVTKVVQSWDGEVERTTSWLGSSAKHQRVAHTDREFWPPDPSRGITGSSRYSKFLTEEEARRSAVGKFMDEDLQPVLAGWIKKGTADRIDAHVAQQTALSEEDRALERRALRHLFVANDPDLTVGPESLPAPAK